MTKTGTFEDFKALTIAVARGERAIDPNEARIWTETREGKAGTETEAAVRIERVARSVEDLDEDTVKAIAASAVPTSYAELDKLIQDWTP